MILKTFKVYLIRTCNLSVYILNFIRTETCHRIETTCIAAIIAAASEIGRYDLHNELHPRSEFVVQLKTNSDPQGKRREVQFSCRRCRHG